MTCKVTPESMGVRNIDGYSGSPTLPDTDCWVELRGTQHQNLVIFPHSYDLANIYAAFEYIKNGL